MTVIPHVFEAETLGHNCNVTFKEYICHVTIRSGHINKE